MLWSHDGAADRVATAAEAEDGLVQRIVARVQAEGLRRESAELGRRVEEARAELKAFLLNEVMSLGGQRVQDAAHQERKEVLAAMAALHAELEVLKKHTAQLQASHTSAMDGLEQRVRSLRESAGSAEYAKSGRVDDLAASLAQEAEQRLQSEAVLTARVQQLGALEKEVQQLREGLGEEVTDRQAAVSEVGSRLGRQVDENSGRIAQDRKQIEELGRDIHRQMKEMVEAIASQLTEKLDAQGREVAQLQATHASATGGLEANIRSLCESAGSLEEARNKRLGDLAASLEQEAQQRTRSEAALTEQLSTLEKDLQQLREGLGEEINNQRAAISEVGSKLGKHVDENSGKIEEDRRQIEGLGRDIHRQMKEGKQTVEAIASQLTEKLDAQGREVTQLQAAHASATGGLEADIRSLRESAGSLEEARNKRLGDLAASLEQEVQQRSRSEAALTARVQQLSTLEKEVQRLREGLGEEVNNRQVAVSEVGTKLGQHIDENSGKIAEDRKHIEELGRDIHKEIKEMVEAIAGQLMEKYIHLAAALPPQVDAEGEARRAAVRQLEARQESLAEGLREEFQGLIAAERQERSREGASQRSEVFKALGSLHEREGPQAEGGQGRGYGRGRDGGCARHQPAPAYSQQFNLYAQYQRPETLSGTIARLNQGYGFLNFQGRDYFFPGKSVLNNQFSELQQGDAVIFSLGPDARDPNNIIAMYIRKANGEGTGRDLK